MDPPPGAAGSKGPGLLIDETLAIAKQIADALEAAHEHGVGPPRSEARELRLGEGAGSRGAGLQPCDCDELADVTLTGRKKARILAESWPRWTIESP